MKKQTDFKLELPYNFDPSLIEWCSSRLERSEVKNFYLPPMHKDHISAKRYHNAQNGSSKYGISVLDVIDEAGYIKHIKDIAEYFNVASLFQHPYQKVPMSTIDRYVSYGVTSFMVSQDNLAYDIKEKYGDAIDVTASICRKTSMYEILNVDLTMYDNIVLYFPFNRSLDTISKLNDKYNYTMLVNCGCNINCPGHHHWFANKVQEMDLADDYSCGAREGNEMHVDCRDLYLFSDKITTFKLQGREFATSEVMKDINNYYNQMMLLPFRPKDERDEVRVAYFSMFNDNKFLQNEPVKEKYNDFFKDFTEETK